MIDDDTIKMRHKAHVAFDRLWLGGRMKRDQAYRLLARELGYHVDLCHMSYMNCDQCRLVIRATKKILGRKEIVGKPIGTRRKKGMLRVKGWLPE